MLSVAASHITYHAEMTQGSEEWLAVRCGMLTASEMKLILTPTLQPTSNEKERMHLWELLAQRINRYVEPSYVSDDMLRGQADEELARNHYEAEYDLITPMGFIVNRSLGFPIGYSPDGLVGKDDLIECKSRRQRFQVQTIVEHVQASDSTTIPVDYLLQCQTGLWVSQRRWLDFISYSGGMPMAVIRVEPNLEVQRAIIDAATAFEKRLAAKHEQYLAALASDARLVPTERIAHEELLR